MSSSKLLRACHVLRALVRVNMSVQLGGCASISICVRASVYFVHIWAAHCGRCLRKPKFPLCVVCEAKKQKAAKKEHTNTILFTYLYTYLSQNTEINFPFFTGIHLINDQTYDVARERPKIPGLPP